MIESRTHFREIAAAVQSYLVYLQRLGFRGVDCSHEALERIARWGKAPGAADAAFSEKGLAEISADIRNCRGCPLFCPEVQPVMGSGDPAARLIFIGEWPEPEDVASGRPFSGEAGELLTRMIKAMNMKREAVYISQTLKCRPPAQGLAGTVELKACAGFLKREISAIKPKVICTLGDAPLSALFGETPGCEACRGRFLTYQGIPVMPTYPPGYLIAHPMAKRDAWHDLKQILAVLNA